MPKYTAYNQLKPQWLSSALLNRLDLPDGLQPWMLHTDSLTARLKTRFPDIQVHIIFEGYAKALPEEALKLGIKDNAWCWVRSVCLHTQGRPMIIARTVIPFFKLGNPWWFLKQLGHRPLGEVLFETRHIQRTEFEFTRQFKLLDFIPKNHQAWWFKQRNEIVSSSQIAHNLKQMCSESAYSLTARRSIFFRQNKRAPLLLTEGFVNNFPV